MESIIAAIITGIIAAAASIYASTSANDKTVAVLNERMSHMQEQIKRLEDKQDKSNQVKERVALVERDLKTAFIRIDELKEATKK